MSNNNFKIIKTKKNHSVLCYKNVVGTKNIKEIIHDEDRQEAIYWINKFYEEPYKSSAIDDLTKPKEKRVILRYSNGAIVEEPTIDTLYYFVAYQLEWLPIEPSHYLGSSSDEARLSMRNIFLTEDEAILARAKMYRDISIEKENILKAYEN